MPTKSAAQHRLMEAAAHTPGGYGGVPQAVGKEFVGKDMAPRDWRGMVRGFLKWVMEEEQEPEHQGEDAQPKLAAGVILRTPDGKVLLLKRSDKEANYKGHWALPGGGAEPGEAAMDAAIRECAEETGFRPEGLKLLGSVKTPTGMLFHTYEAVVDAPFAATLNEEHTEHGWFSNDNMPSPMHPRVAEVLKAAPQAHDSFAFDRASVRRYDVDGRLHVEKTPISKANVCEYLGSEIPNYEELGLDPARKYKLFRDPEELKKGAATSNNMQLMLKHVPVDADDHKPDLIVGSTGTDAIFEEPYLYNSLVVWAREGVDGIEDESRKEISAGYRYTPIMESGHYKGQAYDGRMTNIIFNHCILCERGRAGSDVVVGDSAPTEKENQMTTKSVLAKLSTKLKSVLAADSNLPEIEGMLAVLAKDAETDANAGIPAGAKAEKKETAGNDAKTEEDEEEEWETAKDAMRKGGMDESMVEACDARFRGGRDARRAHDARSRLGRDETPEEEKERMEKEKKAEDARKHARDKKRAHDAEEAEKKKAEDAKRGRANDAAPLTRQAMDEAIEANTKTIRAQQRALREAERHVRPWIGNIALDSAETADDVYRLALKTARPNLDLKGVDPSAYRAMLELIPQPRGQMAADTDDGMAFDASVADKYGKLFPDAGRLTN
jgi:8-oxo-dGTP pyrophosphatase MutT (NUDIX family)